MCKISVIIPIYNSEKYLKQCLNSIINQTLEDIEVICVDDGSWDKSSMIVLDYMEKYDNFILLKKENGGQSSARNLALKNAHGKYIYFLDSDDYIEPVALKSLYEKAEKENLDIIFFDTTPFFENQGIYKKNINYVNYYVRKGKYKGIVTGQEMFTKMRENREFFVSPCLELFRKELIDKNSIEFYEGIIHEDNLFTFQCVMLAKRVMYMNSKFHHRRLHDESTMTKAKSIKNVEGYIVSYIEVLSFLRKIEIDEKAKNMILDFIYYGLYRNAFWIWNDLKKEQKEVALQQGGIVAVHLLQIIENSRIVEEKLRYFEKHNNESGLIRKIYLFLCKPIMNMVNRVFTVEK